jgi:hypothetical protein
LKKRHAQKSNQKQRPLENQDAKFQRLELLLLRLGGKAVPFPTSYPLLSLDKLP